MEQFENKTIVITGATGLIGSNLVERFMGLNNVNIIIIARNEEKVKNGFADYIGKHNFKYYIQDICCPFTLEEKVDFIFHAAGPMEGKIIANYPVDVIRPNINGTINCLEFLKTQQEKTGLKGRLILFSSVTVYGNISGKDITVKEEDTRVTDSLNVGNSCYSQSKRMIEVMAYAYAKQYGIDVVIARFSTVYGKTRFVPDTAFYEFIKKALSEKNIELNSAGLARRDNIYVDDAISALLVIASKGKIGEAYNVSSNGEGGNFASVDEIAITISQIANSINNKSGNIKVVFKNKNIIQRAAGIKLDNNKLKELGWNLSFGLEQGIAETLNGMRV